MGSGYLSKDWLRSCITSLFKKRVTSDPNRPNYRPVALTATWYKVMESVIKDTLLQYLTSRGLMSKKLHAFINSHSIISLNSRLATDIVFIDFSRAFDIAIFKQLLGKR